MKRIRNILGGLFVTLLAFGGGNFAKAQDTKGTTKTTPVKAGKKFTPEELVVVLENLGFNPKIVEDKKGNAISIDLEIAQSGWTFRPLHHLEQGSIEFLPRSPFRSAFRAFRSSGKFVSQQTQKDG
jgi:hypothetical protein